VWRGDAILRHNALLSYDAVLKSDNPAGRPPSTCSWPGRFGGAGLVSGVGGGGGGFLLLWQLVMLGPTILAEDAPHFCARRIARRGLLPAIGLAPAWSGHGYQRWHDGQPSSCCWPAAWP
jgi:hypothetical protein